MLKKFCFLLFIVVALSACSTVPNPIALEVRDTVYVENVDIKWMYGDGKNAGDYEYEKDKKDLIERLHSAVKTTFATSPSGPEAVDFKIHVRKYSRVNAFVGNVLGGSNHVSATVTVVRKKDGQELGKYEKVSGIHSSGGGILGAVIQAAMDPDIVGIMANSFASNLRKRFDSK